MLDVDREAITDGPVGRVLLLLAAPLVAQNLVYVANALVDTFWLGRVSEDAVAAVGLSLPIQSLLGAAVVIAAVGTQILVAQRAGGEDGSGARRVAVNARSSSRSRSPERSRSPSSRIRRSWFDSSARTRRSPAPPRRTSRLSSPCSRSARSATRWRTASPPTATRGPSST